MCAHGLGGWGGADRPWVCRGMCADKGWSTSGYCLIHNYIFIMTKLGGPLTLYKAISGRERCEGKVFTYQIIRIY